MKSYFSILLGVLAYFGFTTFTTSAHPGSGIVVDAQGRVYFSEAGDIDAHLPGGIKGLAFGPDDSLYVAYPSAVLKVTTNETVSTVIHPITVPDCDREFPPATPESHSPYLRGLAVDARGTIFAAATGCRAVVKITADGQVSVVLRAERPWSPTGIAVHGEEVYVMEYEHSNSANREEWVPSQEIGARWQGDDIGYVADLAGQAS